MPQQAPGRLDRLRSLVGGGGGSAPDPDRLTRLRELVGTPDDDYTAPERPTPLRPDHMTAPEGRPLAGSDLEAMAALGARPDTTVARPPPPERGGTGRSAGEVGGSSLRSLARTPGRIVEGLGGTAQAYAQTRPQYRNIFPGSGPMLTAAHQALTGDAYTGDEDIERLGRGVEEAGVTLQGGPIAMTEEEKRADMSDPLWWASRVPEGLGQFGLQAALGYLTGGSTALGRGLAFGATSLPLETGLHFTRTRDRLLEEDAARRAHERYAGAEPLPRGETMGGPFEGEFDGRRSPEAMRRMRATLAQMGPDVEPPEGTRREARDAAERQAAVEAGIYGPLSAAVEVGPGAFALKPFKKAAGPFASRVARLLGRNLALGPVEGAEEASQEAIGSTVSYAGGDERAYEDFGQRLLESGAVGTAVGTIAGGARFGYEATARPEAVPEEGGFNRAPFAPERRLRGPEPEGEPGGELADLPDTELLDRSQRAVEAGDEEMVRRTEEEIRRRAQTPTEPVQTGRDRLQGPEGSQTPATETEGPNKAVRLSGNERGMLVQRAAELHPERFESYRSEVVGRADEFGFDREELVTHMDRLREEGETPELVRVIDRGVPPTPGTEVRGRETTILTADGRELPAYYAVVPSSAAPTSHDPTSFQQRDPARAPSARYQDRRYHDDRAAQEGVTQRAQNLEPKRLVDPTADPTVGPPIIDPVDDPETAPELMAQFNDPLTKARDPLAEAAVGARRLVEGGRSALTHLNETLDADQTVRQYLDTAAGREFTDQLVQTGVIPQQKAAQFRDDETGLMNSEGRRFVERTLMSAAVGDADVVDRAPDAHLRNLEKALPAIVRTKEVNGWDLSPMLQEALDAAQVARAEEVAPRDLLAQTDLMESGEGRFSEPAVQIAEFMEENGPNATAKAVRGYAQDAEASANRDLFGDRPTSPEESVALHFGDQVDVGRLEGLGEQPRGADLEDPAPDRTVAELREAGEEDLVRRKQEYLDQRLSNLRERPGEYGDPALVRERLGQGDLLGGTSPAEGGDQFSMGLEGEGGREGLSDAERHAQQTVDRLRPIVEDGEPTVAQLKEYREALALLNREGAQTEEETRLEARIRQREAGEVGPGEEGQQTLLEGAPVYGDMSRAHAERTFGSVEEAERVAEQARQIEMEFDRETPGRIEAVREAKQDRTWVDLRGKKVEGAEDVHRLIHPFRDPTAERLHVLHLDDEGTVLAHDFMSAGAINYAGYPDQYLERFRQRAERIGTERVILAHNHPSGDPKPSEPLRPDDEANDIAFTRNFANFVAHRAGVDVDGHYVIDHDTGYWIPVEKDPGKTIEGTNMRGRVVGELEPVQVDPPASAADWTDGHGENLRGPEDVARAVAGTEATDRLDVVYATLQNDVVAIEPHRPESVKTMHEWMPQRVRAHGAGQAFLVTDRAGDPDLFDRAVEALNENPTLTVRDIVEVDTEMWGGAATRSAKEIGKLPDTEASKSRPTVRLREREEDYGPGREADTEGRLRGPGAAREADDLRPAGAVPARAGEQFEILGERDDRTAAERAREGIVDPATPRRRIKRLWEKVTRFFSLEEQVEALQPLYELAETAEGQLGRDLDPSEHPYILPAALATVESTRTKYMIRHGMIDMAGNPTGGPALAGVAEQVKDATLPEGYTDFSNREAFTVYLWARRTRALQEDPEGARESGLEYEDALEIIGDLDPVFGEAAEGFYEWSDGILDYAAEASPTFAKIVERVRDRDPGSYIPLQRVFEDLDQSWQRGGAMATPSSPVKRLKGSERKIKDPIQTMIAQAEATLQATHRRATLDAVVRLARVPGMEGAIQEVEPDRAPVATRDLGDIIERVRREIEAEGGKLEVRPGPGGDLDLMGRSLTFFAPAKHPPGHEPIVPLWDGEQGKVRWFEVHPDLYRSLEALAPHRQAEVTGIALADELMKKWARAVRAGTTGLRASFGLVWNALRDPQTLYVNSKASSAGPRLLVEWLRGMKNVTLNKAVGSDPNEWVDLYMRLGTEMSQSLGQDIPHTRTEARKLFQGRTVKTLDPRNWLEWYRELIQSPEAAPRLAEIKGLAEDMDIDITKPISLDQSLELLLAGKQVTTDFTAAGHFQRKWNQIVPFANASIQGPRANLRAARRNPRKFMARGLQLTALSLLLWWQYKDEEWWQQLDPREKFLHWHVPIDVPEKTLVRIPRAFEVGLIFSALPEALADSWYQSDPENMTEWFETFRKSATPPMLPAPAEVAAEQLANEQFFFDSPIVPMSLQRKPAEEQFNEYTSRLAVELGDLFGASPKRIDHALRGVFGPVGGDILAAVGMGPKDLDRERELADTPVVGRLFVRGGQMGRSKTTDNLYDRLEELQTIQASDRQTETPIQRQSRLLLSDAAKAVSALYFLRTHTKSADRRRRMNELINEIASDALEAADNPLEARGRFRRLRKMGEAREEAMERKLQGSSTTGTSGRLQGR